MILTQCLVLGSIQERMDGDGGEGEEINSLFLIFEAGKNRIFKERKKITLFTTGETRYAFTFEAFIWKDYIFP